MPKLGVIIASTRPGRVGGPVAQWFVEAARAHGAFEVDVLDLQAIALPLFDEPHHPKLRNYQHAHTRAWSARVAAQDAFVIVTPEYNHGSPPALVNAFEYLLHEWAYKPAGLVSYGGVSAGTRSASMTKSILVALKVMPLPESVAIPFVAQHVQDGRFAATPGHEQAAQGMLTELARWAGALAPLRA